MKKSRPSPPSLLGQNLSLKIESLAIGGHGVARHEGMVIFVPFGVPEDELLAEVIEQKSNFAQAEIRQIVKPSPHRQEPPCPYFFSCGGCNWQHIQTLSQLHFKHQIVAESLKKFAGYQSPLQPIVASPQSWRYRNRIQLAAKDNKLGFKKRKSHEVIDIQDCLISEESLIQLLPEIREKMATSNSEHRLEVFLDDEGRPRWQNTDNTESGPVGFSQVNRFQNENLIQTVLEWAGPSPAKILELYAGAGNFTFPLNKRWPLAEITAVELSPILVQRALQKQKSQSQVQILQAEVENFLRRRAIENFDLALLDPPRQGVNAYIMSSLAWAGIRKILYLSCHPVSLGRDLAYLFEAAEKAGKSYKVTRVQPFEMFPHTDHVETLVELRVD